MHFRLLGCHRKTQAVDIHLFYFSYLFFSPNYVQFWCEIVRNQISHFEVYFVLTETGLGTSSSAEEIEALWIKMGVPLGTNLTEEVNISQTRMSQTSWCLSQVLLKSKRCLPLVRSKEELALVFWGLLAGDLVQASTLGQYQLSLVIVEKWDYTEGRGVARFPDKSSFTPKPFDVHPGLMQVWFSGCYSMYGNMELLFMSNSIYFTVV